MVNSTFSSAFQDTTPGQLVLHVCGSTRDGQIIRLRSPKCTVGSGPRCTLRLAAGGVAPLHCLILRGPAGAVVRRWSADTRLNGQAFTDAELVPGDRLSIGSIELEVLDMGLTECEPSTAQPTGVTTPWQQQWQAEREELECQLSQRESSSLTCSKPSCNRGARRSNSPWANWMPANMPWKKTAARGRPNKPRPQTIPTNSRNNFPPGRPSWKPKAAPWQSASSNGRPSETHGNSNSPREHRSLR